MDNNEEAMNGSLNLENIRDDDTFHLTEDYSYDLTNLSVHRKYPGLVVLYATTTVLSVLGNSTVIVVLAMGKRSQTDLTGFLISLAAADLIMAVFCMPFTFTLTMLNNWIFGQTMCTFVLYMQTVSVTASVGTSSAIAIDRYLAVTRPLLTRRFDSCPWFVLAGIWTFAACLSLVQLIVGRATPVVLDSAGGPLLTDCGEEWPLQPWRVVYTVFILFVTYLLPVCVISGAYSVVCRKLWRRRAPGNADYVRDLNQLKSTRKVMSLTIQQ